MIPTSLKRWLDEFREGWRVGCQELREARAAYHAARERARTHPEE
jgi:hypothetical protein